MPLCWLCHKEGRWTYDCVMVDDYQVVSLYVSCKHCVFHEYYIHVTRETHDPEKRLTALCEQRLAWYTDTLAEKRLQEHYKPVCPACFERQFILERQLYVCSHCGWIQESVDRLEEVRPKGTFMREYWWPELKRKCPYKTVV
jgi:hypothetical protein